MGDDDDVATKALMEEYHARQPIIEKLAHDRKAGVHKGKEGSTVGKGNSVREDSAPQLLKDLTQADIDFLDFAREESPLSGSPASLTQSEEKFLETMSEEGRLNLTLIASRWKRQSSKALYVYSGLKYCVTHKSVWFPILTYLVINILLTTAVFLFLGLLTGSLQYKWVQATIDPDNSDDANDDNGEVDDFDEWFALLYTLYLLVIETTIITRIVGGVFLDRAKREIFDIAFASERPVLLSNDSDLHIKRMSTAPTKERLQVTAFVIGTMVFMELLTAPLLLMPVVGQILACLVMSWASAWMLLTAFFTRQGLSLKWQARLIYMRFGEYMAFGVPVTIIQHIPIISSLFVFVDVTGAALWAVDMASLSNAFRYIKLNADQQRAEAGVSDSGGLTPSNSLGALEISVEDGDFGDMPDGIEGKYECVTDEDSEGLDIVL